MATTSAGISSLRLRGCRAEGQDEGPAGHQPRPDPRRPFDPGEGGGRRHDPGESAAEPLLQAVYEEVLKAGGHPIVNMALEDQSSSYFKHASDAQLDWVSPLSEWTVNNADVRIAR